MRKFLPVLTMAMLAGCASTGGPSGGGTSGGGGSYGSAKECGGASYYSDSLAGNSTASGEPYKPRQYTAAHRSLPFGTIIRVVRRDTGEEVEVRVNDRGPFVSGRVVDLSRAAAEDIGLITAGVADVCIYVK